jgi:hypothetical protein
MDRNVFHSWLGYSVIWISTYTQYLVLKLGELLQAAWCACVGQ